MVPIVQEASSPGNSPLKYRTRKAIFVTRTAEKKSVQKLLRVACTQYYSKEYEKFYFRRTIEGKKELYS